MAFFNLLTYKYNMDCENIITIIGPIFLLVVSEGMSLTNKTKYNGLLHFILDLITKKETDNIEDLEQSVTLLN